jgi:hypothetical protein
MLSCRSPKGLFYSGTQRISGTADETFECRLCAYSIRNRDTWSGDMFWEQRNDACDCREEKNQRDYRTHSKRRHPDPEATRPSGMNEFG